MSVQISSKIPFTDLCNLLEKMCSSSREKRGELLHNFISHYRESGNKMKETNPDSDISFYPVLRLLLPQLDRERGAYGVKEHTLAKIYIRILCLPKDGQDANKLLNYRAPKSSSNLAGDFAEVAFWILKNHCSKGGVFNVHQVNMHLDNIALKHAAHDPRGVDAELIAVFRNMSATEQKWFMRILLKDVKIGIGQKRIFRAFHPDAIDLYDVSNNLSKVCHVLHDPNKRLHEVEVEVFSAFRPMLSEQCDVQKVESCMTKCPIYYVETKYDGERFQLHMKDGIYKYFSKNGFDYTSVYGNSEKNGVLTPDIAKLLTPALKNCILDGEMMVWDSKYCCFRNKGDNIDVKSLRNIGYLRPCYCVFDILLYNDEVLTNKPLEERYKYLDSLFTPLEGTLAFTERIPVRNRDDVITELNKAIDAKLEGIMLKDPGSVYKPNNRKAGWYKIKPEYTDGLMDQVDAIIIGGYFGEGRRRGIISHFLLGLAVPSSGQPSEFHSVARVGSGYSLSQLADLLQKLDPYWKPVPPEQCPPGIIWTREKPDVWIEPCNSTILKIKASEIVKSDFFKTGYTLRFPRVEEICDKNWYECATLDDFENLRKNASGKLYSRLVVANNQESEMSPKKRIKQEKAPITVGQQFRKADLSNVVKESDLLQGKEFCVATGCENLSKQDIEIKLFQHGAQIVQNPGPNTLCVLTSGSNIRLRNIIATGHYNVIRTQWILKCLFQEPKELLPWTPFDVISSNSNTEKEILKKFDKYGDSFLIPATCEDINKIFQHMDEMDNLPLIDVNKMAELDVELFSGVSPYSFFRLCYGYFDIYSKLNDPEIKSNDVLDITILDFEFYGGISQKQIDENTTHVIIHTECQKHLREIRDINKDRKQKFYIVSEKWIEESVKSEKRLKETNY